MARYSHHRIQTLLSESDTAANPDIKGAKLEELVTYLFTKIPKVTFFGKNILDNVRAHELDVVFINDRASQINFLEFTLITECKNTDQPVSSNAVRWFISKLRDRSLRSGVLIALSGITGQGTGTDNAHSEVLSAMGRDGVTVIVLDRAEILGLRYTNDLVLLLQTKILSLTVQRTIT